MTKDEIVQHLQQPYRESMLMPGLDDALIGFVENGNEQPRALYDLDRCVEIMPARLGWTFPRAAEILRDSLVYAWWPTAGMPAFAVLAEDRNARPVSFTANISDTPRP